MSPKLDIKENLRQEIQYLQKATNILIYSFNHCQEIGIKPEYTLAELDKWEVFTSRFARTCDITTQKIISSIMVFEKGFIGSMKDKAAFCEKNLLTTTEQEFISLRLTRNFIAHEYIQEDSNDIFKEVLSFYPILLNLIESVVRYCNEKILY